MKNKEKQNNAAQAVFKKTQWKFMMIILSVATVLLAVSFVAIYLFTTLTNQMGITDELRSATDFLVASSTAADKVTEEVTEETLREKGYDFLLYYVEGSVDEPDEEAVIDEDYEYTVTYNVTKSYNTLWNDEDELAFIKEQLIKAVETDAPNVSINSQADKWYLNAFSFDKKYETIARPLEPGEEDEDPVNPVEPADPDDEEPIPPLTEPVIVTISNRWFAIYDYSAQQSTLMTLLLVLIVVFVVAVSAVSLLGFLLSGRVLAPAKDAFARQKELVANASHELKTPITIINANLDVLSANGKSRVEENQKWLNNIEDQTRRMNELVIEMLELSSFESSQYKPDLQNIDLSEEVEGAVLSFEAACFERNIKLETSIKPGISGIMDKRGISKLILILLDNAVKYCNNNGEIKVKLRSQKKTAMLFVANSGNKIPDEKMDKLFDRFYKIGDNSVSFGLGLSMAKSITDNMKGKIDCSSNDDFTEFVATIPLNQ